MVNRELVNRANEVSTKGTTVRGNRETTIIPGNNYSDNYYSFRKKLRNSRDILTKSGAHYVINNLVDKTRKKSISPDELQGSTFTISNFGVFDAVIGTPIINQPNVGILGTGRIKKQPIVIEKNNTDIIAIRSMMMLSLGFDHRLIDGAGGASFISKIKNNLENMDLESIL